MEDFRTRTKVEITLADLDKLEAAGKLQNARIVELERQLAEAKLADPTGVLKDLHAAFHDAMRIVQFAVANLEPTTVRGWPYEALAALAEAIDRIPMDVYVKEMSQDLRDFASLAAGYEEFRRERDKIRPVTAALPSDFGPQTAEAAFVHQARQTAEAEAKAASDE